MKLTYKEFNEVIDSYQVPNGVQLDSNTEILYKFRKGFPNQKEVYMVDNLEDHYPVHTLRYLSDYGIIDSNAEYVVETKNLLLVSEEGYQRFPEYLKEFKEKYIREDEDIHSIIFEFEIKNSTHLVDIESKIFSEIYTSTILNLINDLVDEKYILKEIEDKKEIYRKGGYTNFIDITDKLQILQSSYEGDNRETNIIFEELIEYLKNVGNMNTAFYTTKHSYVYEIVVAHCTYYCNGIEFILYNSWGGCRKELLDLCYNEDRMIMSEKLLYLQNISTYMFKVTDLSKTIGFVGKVSLSIDALLWEMDNPDAKVQNIRIPLGKGHTYSVIEFENVYSDFRSKSLSDIKREDKNCKETFMNFYEKIKEFKGETKRVTIPHPCNTTILKAKIDGEEKYFLALVENEADIQFHAQGHQMCIDPPLNVITPHEYTLSDIKRWMPAIFFNDASVILKGILQRVPRLKSYYVPLSKERRIRLNQNPRTTLYRNFYVNNSDCIFKITDMSDYIELCVNSSSSVTFRQQGKGSIFGDLDVEPELMKGFDCFAGFNVLTTPYKTKLSEKTFRRY